jgi:hypothetical protein
MKKVVGYYTLARNESIDLPHDAHIIESRVDHNGVATVLVSYMEYETEAEIPVPGGWGAPPLIPVSST